MHRFDLTFNYHNDKPRNYDDLEHFDYKPHDITSDSMTLIVAGYREDISKYIERELMDRLSTIYAGKHSPEEMDKIREKRKTDYLEWINNEIKLRNFILDTPEIKNKALEYAESVRKKNVEILRGYGLKI